MLSKDDIKEKAFDYFMWVAVIWTIIVVSCNMDYNSSIFINLLSSIQQTLYSSKGRYNIAR